MRRPKRSTLLLALVVVLLATIPVLIPLLVTKAGGSPAPVAPQLLVGAATPGGPTMVPRPPSATATTRPRPPAAGSLAPTTATPTTSPSPSPTTSSPTPTGATAPVPTPDPTTPAPTPTEGRPKVQAAGPDLTVVAITWSPAPPTTGQPIVFSATVRNTGSDPTPTETHGVAFSVDGTKVTWSAGSTDPLGPGEERTYTADGGTTGNTWLATPGPHTLEAWADDATRIPETDETNNTATATFTV